VDIWSNAPDVEELRDATMAAYEEERGALCLEDPEAPRPATSAQAARAEERAKEGKPTGRAPGAQPASLSKTTYNGMFDSAADLADTLAVKPQSDSSSLLPRLGEPVRLIRLSAIRSPAWRYTSGIDNQSDVVDPPEIDSTDQEVETESGAANGTAGNTDMPSWGPSVRSTGQEPAFDSSLPVSGVLPPLFEVLEQFSGEPTNLTSSGGVTYVAVPRRHVKLKSLAWTVRVCRMVLYARAQLTEAYITQRRQNVVADTGILSPQISQRQVVASLAKEAPREPPTDIPDEQVSVALNADTGAAEDLSTASQTFGFIVMDGKLTRLEAESLPHFLLYWAKNRYGAKALVLQLLWTFIACLCFYQYENPEAYLFARLLFDLDPDYSLTYLDLRRALELDRSRPDAMASREILRPQYISLERVASLVNAIFIGWDARRRYVLVENLFSLAQLRPRGPRLSEQEQPNMIPFQELAALVLYSYGVYRQASWRSLLAIWNHTAAAEVRASRSQDRIRRLHVTSAVTRPPETVPAHTDPPVEKPTTERDNTGFAAAPPTTMGFAAFSSMLGSVFPLYDQGSQAEFFYAFSDPQGAKPAEQNLYLRRLSVRSFGDMFVSACFARTATLSSEALEKALGGDIRKKVLVARTIYGKLVEVVNGLLERRTPSVDQKVRLRNLLNVCECSLDAYDSSQALRTMREVMDLILDEFSAEAEVSSLVLSSGLAALSTFLAVAEG